MIKINQSIISVATTVLVFLSACSENISSPPTRTAACEIGDPISDKIFIKASEAPMRVGSGDEYKRVVNRRATEVLGETHYRDLGSDYVLQGMCQTEHWVLGKIVEVEGSPRSWETGWVKVRYIAIAEVGWRPRNRIVLGY